jgi:ABC-type uncharacterized transport system permease subunit
MILASASLLSLSLALGAIAAYRAAAAGASRWWSSSARPLTWLAWLMHGAMLASNLLADQPRFGFAPALSVMVWLIAAVYAVETYLFPMLNMHWPLSALGTGAIVLALVFPGTPLHAGASAWLPLHWALGIASYGMFGTAVVHAWFMTRTEARIRRGVDAHSGVPLLTMERLTFRFIGAGFLLLTATLVLGLVFGGQLYGARATLRWDHKTAFSVLSWLTFAWLLIGRVRFGWRGKRAVRILYIGSGLLLLAYVGSRFVMEVVLGRSG